MTAAIPAHTMRRFLPYLLLPLAVLIAYGNVYDNAFLFDDELIITRNELLRSWASFGDLFTASTTTGVHIEGGFYRPMQLLAYFAVYQLAGLSTIAFHCLNVTLHAANACLLYMLGRRLRLHPLAVFLGALIWAVHPIHTEAVTYMSATADVLFGFFCLSGCVVILPDASPRRIALALPLFILGLASKETAVVFPALAASCLWLVNQQSLPLRAMARRFLPRLLPLFIIAIAYAVWRMGAEGFDGPRRYESLYQLPAFHNLALHAHHFSYRLWTFLATLPAYAGLLLWPSDLHMERNFTIYLDPFHGLVIGGMTMVAVATGLIIGGRNAALTWGLIWFAAAHIPSSGLLVTTNSLFLEHWMYVPSAGLFIAILHELFVLIPHRIRTASSAAMIAIALTIAACLTVRTLEQNRVWHDPIAFYKNIFAHGEVSARGHNNLALVYMNQGDLANALAEFRAAIAISDTYAETRHNYGLALLNQPNPDHYIPEAIDNLNHALQIDPNFYRASEALATIYAHLGDAEKADHYARQATESKARLGHK